MLGHMQNLAKSICKHKANISALDVDWLRKRSLGIVLEMIGIKKLDGLNLLYALLHNTFSDWQ